MAVEADNRPLSGDRVELTEWLDRVRVPWSPLMAAERQFDALIDDREGAPGLVAHDHLNELANLALQWLEDNPCPDGATGRLFEAQMMAYGAVADAVRSSLTAQEGDAKDLRSVIDEMGPTRTHVLPETVRAERGT